MPVHGQRVSGFTKGKDVFIFGQTYNVAFLTFAVELDRPLAFQIKTQLFLMIIPLLFFEDDVEELYVVGTLLYYFVVINEVIVRERMAVSFIGVYLLLFDVDEEDGAVPVKLVLSFLCVV